MNKRYLLPIVGTILTFLVLVLVVKSLVSQRQQDLLITDPVATSSSTTIITEWPKFNLDEFDLVVDPNGEQRINHVPLLAGELRARQDWNPTVSVTGMYRVEDDVPILSNPNVTPYKTLLNTGYVLLAGDTRYADRDRPYSPPLGNSIGLSEDNIKDFDEFIIFDYEGNILHKYHLDDGYSLVGATYGPYSIYYGSSLTLSQNKTIVVVSIYDFSNTEFGQPKKIYYTLNLVTGEIVSGWNQ